VCSRSIDKYKLVKPTKNLDLVTIKPVSEMLEFWTADEKDWIAQAKHPWAALGFAMLSACYGILHALAWNTKFPSRRQRILWRVSSLLIAVPSGAWLQFMILLMGIRLLMSFKTALSRRRQIKASTNETSTSVADIQPPVSASLQPQSDKPKHQAEMVLGVQLPDHKLSGAADFAWVVLKGVIKWVLLYATGAYLCLYVPARTYVVGESFRMAFCLPPDAFRATNWEKYFPHFG
jgi:ABC-type proline/glycine betaine transport system permease subunit